MLGNNAMEIASTEVTWRTINISSILKVESMAKFPRRINVTISAWIRLSKSMSFRRTFHVEFRRRIEG